MGESALSALARFAVDGEPVAVEPLRVGRIHESHVATCRAPAGPQRYLLQRLNTRVFTRPEAVMGNILRVTEHLRRKLAEASLPDAERRVLTPLAARDGRFWHVDGSGGWWRAYAYVEGSVSRDRPDSLETARRAGEAFGAFVAALTDLPGPRLEETLPTFHDTPARYRTLLAALDEDRLGRSVEALREARLLEARAGDLGQLQQAAARREIPDRVVHNDTKLSNVLFDAASGEALCVVDLDTVMPGLALHDFGDLVRSAATDTPEDTSEPGTMRLSLPLFRSLTRGWLAPMAALLTPGEIERLPLAPRLVALELAIRFLTDHVEGDHYFRVERPGQNLDRCRAQLTLAIDMERQEDGMAAAVREALGG